MAAARSSAGPLRPSDVYATDRVSMEYTSRRGGTITGAVRNVTLRIESGEMVAITGRSGSGKSSLLQLLAGLDTPTGGAIHFRPQPEEEIFALHSLSENQRARLRGKHVGFVFQAFHLLPALTAWENVAIPLMFSGVPLARRREEAHSLLDLLGMRALTERYPYELSGGEQQRIAIARALANQPSVLLADEPTGNLDSASANAVIELINAAYQERGITTVLVTHDLNIAYKLGARTVEMHDGAIVNDSAMERNR